MKTSENLKCFKKKKSLRIGVFFIIVFAIGASLYFGKAYKFFETKPCPDNVRAYEFGRTMSNYKFNMGNKLSLEESIVSYSKDFMMSPAFEATNPCVVKGFEDAENSIPSVYNLNDEKSWRNF